ncbi:hypothetical protein P5614_022370, partial (plasmid) [Bacillus velezensis]|uniref:hypothetical protein n=1 Tax=Bacillus velezensis TaxID=492670 RepID=UPI003CE68983
YLKQSIINKIQFLSRGATEMQDKLMSAVHFIEVNRDEMGDKKSLNMLLKAVKKIINEGEK